VHANHLAFSALLERVIRGHYTDVFFFFHRALLPTQLVAHYLFKFVGGEKEWRKRRNCNRFAFYWTGVVRRTDGWM